MDCGKCLCANIHFKQWGVRHCRVSISRDGVLGHVHTWRRQRHVWSICRRSPGPMRGSCFQTRHGSFIIRQQNNGHSNSNFVILNRCVIINSHQLMIYVWIKNQNSPFLCLCSALLLTILFHPNPKTNPSCTITSQNSLSDSQHPSTDQYRASIQILSPFNNTFYSSLIDGSNRNRL